MDTARWLPLLAALAMVGWAGEPPVAPLPPTLTKVAYLGVATAPAGDALREQLRLPRGVGLVVLFVEKGSPAEKAGLRRNDVLVRLRDQILINPSQLACLVRMQKPGEAVDFALFRGGTEGKARAELSEKAVVLEADTPWEIEGLPLADHKSLADAIRMLVRAVPPEMAERLPPCAGQPSRDGKDDSQPTGKGGASVIELPAWGGTRISETSVLSDGEHMLVLTETAGKRHLAAKDRDGKVLFDGPIDTEEQLKGVPEAIRRKLQDMQASVRARLEGGVTPLPGAEPRKP